MERSSSSYVPDDSDSLYQVSIFFRTSPKHKVKIIKVTGHMTGAFQGGAIQGGRLSAGQVTGMVQGGQAARHFTVETGVGPLMGWWGSWGPLSTDTGNSPRN